MCLLSIYFPDMIPDEKFEAPLSHCTIMLVTDEQFAAKTKKSSIENQPTSCDISLSAFSDIYNEYLSDNSEVETASTSDTDSSTSNNSCSVSISTPTSISASSNHQQFDNVRANQRCSPVDIRGSLQNNQLFGVQLEVNFLLLEAERRKLKVLQRELNLSLDECDKYERKKRNQSQCHELLVAISWVG